MIEYKKSIRWILAICCIGYIIWFFSKNTDELAMVLKLRPLPIIIVACFFISGHTIYCYRFKIVLEKCSGSPVPFWPWFKMVLLGRFLSTFAPHAANIYRSICLKKNYQIAYTHYASSLFSFMWMDTCLNMLYSAIIILAVKSDLRIGNFKALNFLLFLISLTIATPLLLVFLFKIIKFRNRYLSWVHSKLSQMLTISVANLSSRAYMLKIVLTGIIAFINSIMIFYFCFSSLEIPIDLPVLALFYVILKLSTQITLTPGNLGVQELAYGILGEQIHLGMAQGIIISVIIRVLGTTITIIMGTLAGGIDLLRHRKDYSKIEQ